METWPWVDKTPVHDYGHLASTANTVLYNNQWTGPTISRLLVADEWGRAENTLKLQENENMEYDAKVKLHPSPPIIRLSPAKDTRASRQGGGRSVKLQNLIILHWLRRRIITPKSVTIGWLRTQYCLRILNYRISHICPTWPCTKGLRETSFFFFFFCKATNRGSI